jgi:hypothetical protein
MTASAAAFAVAVSSHLTGMPAGQRPGSFSMYFSIDQWRAWAPGLESAADWNAGLAAPALPLSDAELPAVSFLPAMQRRRLSTLGRMLLHVSWPLAEGQPPMPLVFVSRHGETPRTLAILQALGADEPLSPTQFSLSVHNAIIGQWSILRGDSSEMTALAGEGDGLENGVLEALSLLAEGAPAVLLVVAEEAQPALYAPFIDDVPCAYALALRLVPGRDWQLQLASADGARAGWPHAFSLLQALTAASSSAAASGFTHYWNRRQWTWSRNKA